MTTVLVTRPLVESESTKQALEDMGHDVMLAPMINIEPISFPLPDASKSLIITSKNGARFGLKNLPELDRKIFAVGKATADIVRDMGFNNVVVGPGNAKGLMPLLIEEGISNRARFTHLCGEDLAYNIADALSHEGIEATHTVTYSARQISNFDADTWEALEAGKIDAVLFYSARTATIFEGLVAEAGHMEWLKNIDAYVMSTRVKEEMIGPWRSIKYAIIPSEKALLKLIKSPGEQD